MTENLLGPLAERLDPALVSPLVAYLVHEDCTVSGEVFSCGGGRVARVFVAATPGMFDPAPTPEAVRDGWDAVVAEDGYIVPRQVGEELRLLATHLRMDSRTG